MDEEALIEEVKRYQFLYDLSDSRYSNKGMRSNAWEEIAEDMGEAAEDCKNCWRKLRENYRKAMLLRKTKSGQSAKKIRAWRFEEAMSFLTDHFQERPTHSNVSESSSSQGSRKETPPRDSSVYDDDNDDDRPNVDDDVDDVDDLNDDVNQNERDKSIQRRGLVVNTKDNGTVPKSAGAAPKSKYSNGIISKKKNSNAVEKPPKDVATALIEYLKNKPRKKPTEEEQEAEEESTKRNRAEKKDSQKKESPLMKFFIAMGETVETLPIGYQLEIKSEVFEIVNEFEIRAAKNTASQDQPRAYYEDDRTLYDLPNLYRGNSHDMDTNPRTCPIVAPEETSGQSTSTFYSM